MLQVRTLGKAPTMEASVLKGESKLRELLKEGLPAQGQLSSPVVQGAHAAYLVGSIVYAVC